tara:strand:- start:234 stop:1031 length:798 start_codon:yes stop_codon:yes gene_type:complete
MSLLSKIEATLLRTERLLEQYRAPALMVSFGKDSMVMLHLFAKFDFPVICHIPPYDARKWEFARSVIAQWNLSVHDWPPAWVALQESKHEDSLELVTAHDTGSGDLLMLQQHIEPTTEGNYLCGLRDLLARPTGSCRTPWDLVLAAQKDGDADRHYGRMPVEMDLKRGVGRDTLFPLRDWTDADIWEYTEKFDVPVHHARYEHDGLTYTERADRSMNPDWIQACTRCIDRSQSGVVRCPKLQVDVENVSARIKYIDVATGAAATS